MRGPYKQTKYTNFSGGLATKREPNLIDDSQSPDLQNVVFDGAGSFQPRYGSELFGVSASIAGHIGTTWVTQNMNDIEYPLRSVNTSASQYIEYYNPWTASWELLDAGYTKNLNFGHCNYNYYTYFVNQKEYQRRWNGVAWGISTYADSSYSAIDLSISAASALGFLSAGSVVVDGEEVYYSSYNGTRLSGITFANAHNGSVAIAQLPTSALEAPAPDGGWISASSALPRGSMMLEMDAQIFVAGASGVSGNRVYYSVVDEPTNYTVSATPGGGGIAKYPETIGSITGISDFDEALTVFKKDTIRKLKFVETNDGTAGSLEIVSRNDVVTSPKVGSITHRSIAKTEGDVMYVTPAGWIKSVNKVSTNVNSTELSLPIRPTVEGLDMTSAASVYFAGKTYVACATSASAFNNVVLVWDTDYKAWSRFVGWNVSDWFIYGNTLYFGASNENATYKALTGFADNGLGYDSYWKSKDMDFGEPSEQKRLNQVYIEGYIAENATIGVSAYYDGTNSYVAKSIEGTGDYVSNDEDINLIGGTTWGIGLFGSGTDAGSVTLRKFRWWGRYSPTPFYTLQLKIGSSQPGYAWKVTHIAPYLVQVPGKRVPTNSQV